MKYISQVVEKKQLIIKRVILKIHQLVTDKTLPQNKSGHYRQGLVYVVRRKFGLPQKIVYTAPKAKKVPELMTNLIKWIHQTEKEDILKDIVYSYIKKDIFEANIRQEDVFYKLFKILASQSGNLVNSSELASTLGVSRTAVEDYLYIMQT